MTTCPSRCAELFGCWYCNSERREIGQEEGRLLIDECLARGFFEAPYLWQAAEILGNRWVAFAVQGYTFLCVFLSFSCYLPLFLSVLTFYSVLFFTFATQGHGPLIGGTSMDSKDAAVAPKLYHACIACKAIKVSINSIWSRQGLAIILGLVIAISLFDL